MAPVGLLSTNVDIMLRDYKFLNAEQPTSFHALV